MCIKIVGRSADTDDQECISQDEKAEKTVYKNVQGPNIEIHTPEIHVPIGRFQRKDGKRNPRPDLFNRVC